MAKKSEYDSRGLKRVVPLEQETCKEKGTCLTCRHAYNPHELNVDGKYFLCKCKLHQPWSKFVHKDTCKDYEKSKPLDLEYYNF